MLYLTALSETHQTLLAQARTFSFFDPAMVSHTFYYASLYRAIELGASPRVHATITSAVTAVMPRSVSRTTRD